MQQFVLIFKLIVSDLVSTTAGRGQTNMAYKLNTGRRSKVSLLHSSRLGSVTSLAEDPKRTE